MNYNCTSNTCYPPYRTNFDRMMQKMSSNTCLPSGQLVCNSQGQLVMTGNAVQENFRHKRTMQKRRRRRVKERYNGNSKGTVTILLMKGCGFCEKLKAEMGSIVKGLKQNGVNVQIVDESKDPTAFKAAAQKLGAKGFPSATVTASSGTKTKVDGYMSANKYVQKCMEALS